MLVTLNEMKSYLGLTNTTYDAFLTQQGTLVSNIVEAYCRRTFSLGSYVQTFYNDENLPAKTITPFHFPLTEVDTIVEDSVTLSASLYRLHKPTGIITQPYGYFFQARETVVTYTAGYANIPDAIKSVVLSVVQERYNKKTSGIELNFGSDVQRISIPGAISIDFDYSLSNNERKSAFGSILGSQVNILDYFRSERAVLGSDKLEYIDDGDAPATFGTYDAPLTITASDGIESSSANRQMVFVKSAGGAVTITANPQIAPGQRVGQELIVEGVDDTDYIVLNNGNGLGLVGSIQMVDQQILALVWDGFIWVETSRN